MGMRAAAYLRIFSKQFQPFSSFIRPSSSLFSSNCGAVRCFSGTKIDGKLIAADVTSEVAKEVTELTDQFGDAAQPGLAVVLVGERKDSATYVKMKEKMADK